MKPARPRDYPADESESCHRSVYRRKRILQPVNEELFDGLQQRTVSVILTRHKSGNYEPLQSGMNLVHG